MVVTVWFVPKQAETTMTKLLAPLREHFNKHVPQYAEYLDKDGQPVIGFGQTRKLHDMGAGYLLSSDRKSCHHMRPRRVFLTKRQLILCMSLPIVRDVQFLRDQYARLEKPDFHHVYLQAFRYVKDLRGEPFAPTSKHSTFMAFVRMEAWQGALGKAPALGTQLGLTQVRGAGRGGNQDFILDRRFEWRGTVVENAIACDATRCHFAVLLQKPRSLKLAASPPTALLALDPKLLSIFKIRIIALEVSYTGELQGTVEFCNGQTSETAHLIRNVFMNSQLRDSLGCNMIPEKYQNTWGVFKKYAEKVCGGNRGQLNVIMTLEKTQKRLIAVHAPAATGKTTTACRLACGLVLLHQKTLICGPSDVSMAKAATSICDQLQKLNEDLEGNPGFIPRHYNVLQMKSEGLELQAAEKIKRAIDFRAQENHGASEMSDEEVIDNDAEVTKALIVTTMGMRTFHTQAAALLNQGYEYLAALKEVVNQAKKNFTGSIAALTVPFHMWRICQEQQHAARTRMDRLRHLSRQPKMDKATSDQAQQARQFLNEYEYSLCSQDPITDEQFTNGVSRGDLPSLEELDKSYRFRELQNMYLAAEHTMDKDLRREYMTLWFEKLQEVLAGIDALLTICNNTASGLFDRCFNADVIIFIKAGSLTLQAMSVALTRCKMYRLVYMFGDLNQLIPYTASGPMNEFYEYARMSAMEWLQLIKYPMMGLEDQHRMHPDICHFPNNEFYGGRLKNHPSTLQSNPNREAFYRMTKATIQKQSSYMVVYVQNGRSRACLKWQSSCNYANIHAIVSVLRELIVAGFSASEITMLSYYRGQEQLTRKSLHEEFTAPRLSELRRADFNMSDLTFSTPDTYEGSDKGIILLDLVFAGRCRFNPQKKLFEIDNKRIVSAVDAQDNEEGSDVLYTSEALPSYVRSKNRLCYTLTMPKDGLVIFCHAPTLLTTQPKTKTSTSAQRFLWNLLYDARNRGVLYDDFSAKDTSEQVAVETERMTDQERDMEEKRKQILQDAYLHEF